MVSKRLLKELTVLIGTTVGGNDDIDVLDNAGEGLVELLGVQLQLEQGAVHLVHEEDGHNTLGNGLSEDGLGLDADTGDAVNDDQGTVSHTEGGGDLLSVII